jgi:hypothetical protein
VCSLSASQKQPYPVCPALEKCAGPDDELVLLKVPMHVADALADLEGARLPVDGAVNVASVSNTAVQLQGQAYRLHQVCWLVC